MGSETTLLTHFSQRYPKIPDHVLEQKTDNVVGVAFDYMFFKLGDSSRILRCMNKVATI